MKRIQCEVCGSTSIIKRGDLYECQYCGVQYEPDTISKLLVTIDHTPEVENYILLGNKMEEAGDLHHAKEAYNKALDLDANNQKASEDLKKVSLSIDQSAFIKQFKVCSKYDKSQNSIRELVCKFMDINDIACDIFKYITITDTQTWFVKAKLIDYSLRYNWSAVACHEYYENETVWEYDYSQQKKVPKTQRVTKVDRTPISDTDIFKGTLFLFCLGFSEKSY